MLSSIQRNIIIRAVRIRQEAGEDPAGVLAGYAKLTDTEKAEIMAAVLPGKE